MQKFLIVDGASKVKSNVQEKPSSTNLKPSAKTQNKGALQLNLIKIEDKIDTKNLNNDFCF